MTSPFAGVDVSATLDVKLPYRNAEARRVIGISAVAPKEAGTCHSEEIGNEPDEL
jgi:hypothetical protein